MATVSEPHATPLSLGRLGLGCANFGRETVASAAFAMMDHAVAKGIAHFDTAASYGAGGSEQLLGQWLAARTSVPRPIVATKVKPPFTPEALQKNVDASRRRLGLDVIDLLYVHQWSDELAEPRVLAALDALLGDGTVRHLGASNLDAGQLTRVLTLQQGHGLRGFSVLQNNQNFAVREMDAPLRELCRQHAVALVTYSPLGAGFLTGKHRHGIPEGTRFAVVPGHQKTYFTPRAWERLAQLELLAADRRAPLPLLALAWALNQPGQPTVLVGGRGTEQIDQALAALQHGWPDEWSTLLDAD